MINFKDDIVLFRGVKYPHRTNSYSLHNESYLDTEVRKIARVKGSPTLTKEKGDKDGNINRSSTLLGPKSTLFSQVGYGIVNPDARDVKFVAEYDFYSGEGKKDKILPPEKSKIDQSLPKDKQLQQLKHMVETGDANECNEVVLDIKNNGKIAFIAYNEADYNYSNEESVSSETLRVISIYTKLKFKERLGIDIPIYGFSGSCSNVREVGLSKDEIAKTLEVAIKKDPAEFFCENSMDLFSVFVELIKENQKISQRVSNYLVKNIPNFIDDKNILKGFQILKRLDKSIDISNYKDIFYTRLCKNNSKIKLLRSYTTKCSHDINYIRHRTLLSRLKEFSKFEKDTGQATLIKDISNNEEKSIPKMPTKALLYALMLDKPMVGLKAIKLGADINTCDVEGNTPVHLIVENRDIKTLEQILKLKPKIQVKNKMGDTPLESAIRLNSNAACDMLVKNGARYIYFDKQDITLYIALSKYLKETSNWLIDKNIGLESAVSNGETPLHMAIRTRQVEQALKIIDKISNMNKQTDMGLTPLHYAIRENLIEVSKKLIDKGARLGIKDKNGKSPKDLAKELKIKEIYDYITKKEGKDKSL